MRFAHRASPMLAVAGMFAISLRCLSAVGADAPKKIVPGAACSTDACHQDILKKKFLHGPVAAKECTVCHEPKKEDLHDFKMAAEGDELCGACHDVKGDKKTVHAALEGGCATCHVPHGSDTKALLTAPMAELCGLCHDETVSEMKHHKDSLEGKACASCHLPHAASLPKLLVAKAPDLCMQCHDKPFRYKDRTILGLKDQLAKGKIIHSPAEGGECDTCHLAHGGLVAAYPERFYAPFSVDAYELCFTCHDSSLVTAAETDSDTGFRHGKRNLHTVHVDKKSKGRTCRVCHVSHGGDAAHLIRKSTPFGKIQWPLPIGYKPAETGGACAPGCHKPLTYDRENPVEYGAPAPPEKPAPEPAPAAEPGGPPPEPEGE